MQPGSPLRVVSFRPVRADFSHGGWEGKDISKMLFLNNAWQGIQDEVQCPS